MPPLVSLTLDANDIARLVEFWCAALGYKVDWSFEAFAGLSPTSGEGPVLLVQRVPEHKGAKNRLHFDVHSEDFEAHAEQLVELGATRISPEVQEYGPARWIVMNDPEGNEFCVCNPPPF